MNKVLFVVLFFSLPLIAADAQKPHDHKGIIKAYDDKVPEIPLTQAELDSVKSGTPIYKQTEEGSSGKAVAVFRVNAPEKDIWQVLVNIENYPQWISNLKEAKIYKRDGNKIFAEFTVKVWPTSTTYFIEHNFPSDLKGHGTWKLDYSRLSDLDESVGFWNVKPLDGSLDACLVFYSVDVQVKGFLSLIKGFIVDKGLKEATQWVKLAAEEQFVKNKEKNKVENNKDASANLTSRGEPKQKPL